MDHKAVILLMLAVCFLISEATPTASYSSWKPSSQTPREHGLYDDGVYDQMAGGLTSAQPHPESQDFVLSGRDMLEDGDEGSPYMDDYDKTEVEALLALKSAITYDPSQLLSSWKPENSQNVCSWAGITCANQDSENGCPWNGMPCRQPTKRVVAILLPDFGLQGTLSASLGNLSFLHNFVLSNNSFTGRIPREFGQLKELVKLKLGANKFSGSIPVELGLLQKLEHLDLQYNKLENAIPSSLGNCSSLKSVFLGRNLFSGGIPPHLGYLRELKWLSIYHPRSSFYSSSSSNTWGSISGSIPPQIGNCSNLVVLDLGGNIIHGSVPMSIFQLSLKVLDLGGNNLTGNIPQAITNLSELTRLHLNSNNIRGTIPQAIANLSQLTHLFLDSNALVGSIPKWITRLSELEVLDLSDNNLEGEIPQNICECGKITYLNLRNNSLSGIIPRTLHNCSALKTITVSDNSLSGDLDIGFPVFMEVLSAHSNKFFGTLPTSLVNCTRLQVFDLRNNRLNGELSYYHSNFEDLRVLSVGYNNFYGVIPQWITNLTKLQVLDLSNNKFSGRIPSNLSNLYGFAVNISSWVDRSWFNSHTLYVNLKIEIKGHEYSLSWLLVTNTVLDLSNNNLIGEIPESMGSLSELRLLNLSGNLLEGQIPISLSQIYNLEQLDLAKNHISGSIPQNLSQLYSLEDMDVSSNNLCGEIPNGHQFNTFDERSFQRNKCLCGYPLSPCNMHENEKHNSDQLHGQMNKREGHNNSKECSSHVNHLNMWLMFLGIGVVVVFV